MSNADRVHAVDIDQEQLEQGGLKVTPPMTHRHFRSHSLLLILLYQPTFGCGLPKSYMLSVHGQRSFGKAEHV